MSSLRVRTAAEEPGAGGSWRRDTAVAGAGGSAAATVNVPRAVRSVKGWPVGSLAGPKTCAAVLDVLVLNRDRAATENAAKY